MAGNAASRSTLWAGLLLAVLPLVFGYNWVVMKRVLDYVGPFEFAALLFVLGAAVLFAVLAARRQPLALPHPGPVILVGLFHYTANIGLALWALRGGPIGRSALLNYAMPLWVVLMAWPLLKEKPTRPQWLALGRHPWGPPSCSCPGGVQGRTHAALLTLLSGICWAWCSWVRWRCGRCGRARHHVWAPHPILAR
ncbi:MAG: DMT family transporter [Holophaga sp.]|nr:DMT family transporter [Holophaga sp.]